MAPIDLSAFNEKRPEPVWRVMGLLYRAHPWHGVHIGHDVPNVVTSFIEIVQTDAVKYEIDKISGYLKVDRPQKYSNVSPTLYGFIPQTYCSTRVAELCMQRTSREGIVGDGDPLDICVITEKPISHGDILLKAIPIGGLRMIDGNEADDKIIAVLQGDSVYGSWKDMQDCPQSLVDRLRHYFLTYKEVPGAANPTVEIPQVYGREEAHEVIRRSQEDYQSLLGNLEGMLTNVLSS